MARMPGITQFPLPASYTRGRGTFIGSPRVIVIHYTAGSEGPTAAEDGAAYDRRRTDGTSCHFFTDRNTIGQEVDTSDRSHSALYNGNGIGIHIEQCGTRQTRAQWLDDASYATIRNTAKVCAWAMKAHNIPLIKLTDRQVRAGRGIAGHADITHGFPEDGGTHEDPGTEYPWDILFQEIKAILEGDDVPLTDADVEKIWSYQPAGKFPNAGQAVDQTYRYLTPAGGGGSVYKAISDLADNVDNAKDAEALRDAAEKADAVARDAAEQARDAAFKAALDTLITSGTSVDTAAIVAAINQQSEATRQAVVAQSGRQLEKIAQAFEDASTSADTTT